MTSADNPENTVLTSRVTSLMTHSYRTGQTVTTESATGPKIQHLLTKSSPDAATCPGPFNSPPATGSSTSTRPLTSPLHDSPVDLQPNPGRTLPPGPAHELCNRWQHKFMTKSLTKDKPIMRPAERRQRYGMGTKPAIELLANWCTSRSRQDHRDGCVCGLYHAL